MVEKLKVEIKGSLIYWVCDSQSNYVQFNIALKYDPEGSYFFKKKILFSIFAWNIYYSKSLKIKKTQMCITPYDILKALKQRWQMTY